jgi:hypothetical protein
VREAIDARFAALHAVDADADPAAIVARIHERYPDPPTRKRAVTNVHDRASARRAIMRRLRREHP